MSEENSDATVQVPITGTLDLHGFQPSEIKELIKEYLSSCLDAGILQGRIIHGKGIGTLREIVHSQLRANRHVLSFALGDGNSGGWGSTSFTLKMNDDGTVNPVAQDA